MSALVIGAGPAGLMAAEEMAKAGLAVTVVEAQPTPARKFLMAGKSGLNLTKDEPLERFVRATSARWIDPIVGDFGPEDVRAWAEGLGIPLFTGSSGRVFPVGMKASPLLRAWLARLASLGVTLKTRWRWTGFEGTALRFDTPDGPQCLTPARTVLALGGASWPRLGSDAAWVPWLRGAGVSVAPFRAANMGLVVNWSPHMAPLFGRAVKGVALTAGATSTRGEFVISARGLEGGGIYAVSAAVRDGAALAIDLLPDMTEAEIMARLAQGRKGDSVSNLLKKTLNLPSEKRALLQEWGQPRLADLARLTKALPVHHHGPMPLDRAISSAGGVMQESLTEGLELRALPGVFACGEMLDWEAPTGGYLLTACLATGSWAGRAATG